MWTFSDAEARRRAKPERGLEPLTSCLQDHVADVGKMRFCRGFEAIAVTTRAGRTWG